MSSKLRVALFVAVAALSTAASAQTKPADEGVRRAAARLAEAHPIRLESDEDVSWSVAEIGALHRGADALPPAMFAALEEPIVLRRRNHSCLFGVGRGTSGCPTRDRDGAFLIYDVPPLQGEGPVETLAPLNAAQRTEIQRRRAVVHAVMLAFDERVEWSEDERWRGINGWRSRRQAMNRDPWGYSRYLGARSPRLDLVTFAEEWFVRPVDVVEDPRKLSRDQSVDCQAFTKSRWFARRVVELDPTWHPRARPGDGRCPAFHEWAQIGDIESIDILVAAATADRPESLYGHLLLHVRYRSRSEGFEPVYQFGAVTDTNVDPLTYFSRGLLGGFLSVMEVDSFRGVDRAILQYEQRGLRRYELVLSPTQRRNLMERIWEYERRYRYPYYFFSNNCASFLIDLIGPALELDVPARSHFVVAPTDVLDFLADLDNGERGPLLRKRPEVEFSSREVAQRAVVQRRASLDELIETLGVDSGVRRQLRRLDGELDEKAPERREAAYDRLRILLSKVLQGRGEEAAMRAVDYLYEAVQVEKYFAEVMFFRTRAIRLAATQRAPKTAEELLAERRELFATEDPDVRFEKISERNAAVDRALDAAPTRSFRRGERAELELARATDDAYRAALDAEAHLIDSFLPEFDGMAYVDARREELVAAQERRDARAVGPSGKGRIALGGGAASSDLSSAHGSVFASYSFIYERLGEQRRRGFRSDIETRGVGFELWVPTVDEFWLNADLDVTLFRFLSVAQNFGAVRRGFFDVFGWGADVRLGHDGRRGITFDGGAAGGLLWPVWKQDHWANHLVVGLWADARVQATDIGRVSLVGGDVFARLLVHLGGVYANSLRLEVGSRHFFAVETPGWEFENRARLATEHATFWIGQHPLVLSPWVQVDWTSLDYRELDRDFRGGRAGLSVELPL